MIKPIIALGSPHNGTILAPAARSIRSGMSVPGTVLVEEACSVLTYSFNTVWCKALNMVPRPYYFVMHHADIEAEHTWLYDLTALIESNPDVDVISCNIAIKDEREITSTSVYDPNKKVNRRITLKELESLPNTFGVKDIPWAPPGSILCVNTGLWICRIDDWCENILFHNYDYVEKDSNGNLIPRFWPEDWMFSLDLHRLGKKVMATSAIQVEHCGYAKFNNRLKNREISLTLTEDEWYPCQNGY